MAIFKSHLLGKIRGSVGNISMYTAGEKDIVRGKTLHRHDPQSQEQLAVRARMKAVKKLVNEVLVAACAGFPGRSLDKVINGFVSRNFAFMEADEELNVTYEVSKLQFSSGELAAPSAEAVIDREAATVTFIQHRQPQKPLMYDDDRLFGVIWGGSREKMQVCPLGLRGESVATVVPVKDSLGKHPVQVYVFAVSAAGIKTARTVWLTVG